MNESTKTKDEPEQTLDSIQPAKRDGIFKEFKYFLTENRKWWLIPIIVILVLFGVLIVIGISSPALSPFIYSLF